MAFKNKLALKQTLFLTGDIARSALIVDTSKAKNRPALNAALRMLNTRETGTHD